MWITLVGLFFFPVAINELISFEFRNLETYPWHDANDPACMENAWGICLDGCLCPPNRRFLFDMKLCRWRPEGPKTNDFTIVQTGAAPCFQGCTLQRNLMIRMQSFYVPHVFPFQETTHSCWKQFRVKPYVAVWSRTDIQFRKRFVFDFVVVFNQMKFRETLSLAGDMYPTSIKAWMSRFFEPTTVCPT